MSRRIRVQSPRSGDSCSALGFLAFIRGSRVRPRSYAPSATQRSQMSQKAQMTQMDRGAAGALFLCVAAKRRSASSATAFAVMVDAARGAEAT